LTADKDTFQASLHRAVHSIGIWPPCSPIDKDMDKLPNAFDFVAALLEERDLVGD
jgi:hypothetical protein